MSACAPGLRLLNGPVHRGHQAVEPVFEQVVGGADLQAFHRFLFAHRAGNQDHRHVRLRLLRVLQRGDPVVTRQGVVGDDEIEGALRQRGFETVLAIDEEDVARKARAFQLVADHRGVSSAILQVEHSEWASHIWSPGCSADRR